MAYPDSIYTTQLPSYGSGFARNAGESQDPDMWDNVVGLWPLCLGPTGTRIPSVASPGQSATAVLEAMSTDTDWVRTPFGWGLGFNQGAEGDECVRITHTPVFNGQHGLTIMSVFQANGNHGTSWGRLIHKASSATSESWGLILQNGGAGVDTAVFRLRTNNLTTLSVTDIVSRDEWHVLIGTWTGTTMFLYLDGLQIGTTAKANTLSAATRDLAMGKHEGSTNRWFRGEESMAGFFGTCWSPSKVERFSRDPTRMLRLEEDDAYSPPAAAVDRVPPGLRARTFFRREVRVA